MPEISMDLLSIRKFVFFFFFQNGSPDLSVILPIFRCSANISSILSDFDATMPNIMSGSTNIRDFAYISM